MTTVQQIDPVYVDLTQSSVEGLQLRRDIASGQLKLTGPDQAKVTLLLEDGTQYRRAGTLQFTDITVDPGTGSVTVRAIFPNPRFVLLPGMFVRARIEEGVNENAILVPQVGVTHDPKGQATALVVGADDKVAVRTLQLRGTRRRPVDRRRPASTTAIASSSPAFRRCSPGRWCRRSSRRRQPPLRRPPRRAPWRRCRPGSAAAPGHSRVDGEIGEEPPHGQVLHRPPDLREGHRDPDRCWRARLSIISMPIEQYPTIAPPSIQITATYPGASAKTVENTVMQVIEQQMSGLDTCSTSSSNSDDSGHGDHDADLRGRNQSRHRAGAGAEQAAARHAAAAAQVQQAGVSVTKSSNSYPADRRLRVRATTACRATTSANYVVSHLQDPVSRINGVGELQRVRHAVRDAHLARHRQAQQLRLDAGRCAATRSRTRTSRSRAASSAGLRLPTTQRLTATITEATLLRTPAAVRQHPAARSTPTARRCACATSRASSSARKPTSSTRATTASRRRASASSSRPARTRWPRRRRCAPRSTS